MRGETTIGDADRGQSDVLGVALITALVVVGTVGIVALGSGVIAGGQTDAQIESAEQAMTKLDATAALVALGHSDTQRARVSLGGIGESLNVNPEEGWMNVSIVNRSSGEHLQTVMNRTMGSVVYSNEGTKIAYQGGGVWKKVDGGAIMVSPPEFHYRGNTLTLPLISIGGGGDGVASGDLVLESTRNRKQTYPNATNKNPLPEEKQVNVTVHSEYYGAWGSFFEQRTDGLVNYDHSNNTVTVELVVPFDLKFDAPLIATTPGGVNDNGKCDDDPDDDDTGNSDKPDCDDIRNYDTGMQPVDPEVESQIETCDDNPDKCETRTVKTNTTGLNNAGTYYYPSGLEASDITVDTSSGNVSIVVDGDVDITDVEVIGENSVKWYIRGDVAMGKGGEINSADDNTPKQFLMFVHSSGEVTMKGKITFKGLIYAPGSHATYNGAKNFTGSLVAETITINGVPSNMYTYPGLAEVDLGLGSNVAYVNYLYVSSVEIQVNGTAS